MKKLQYNTFIELVKNMDNILIFINYTFINESEIDINSINNSNISNITFISESEKNYKIIKNLDLYDNIIIDLIDNKYYITFFNE